MVIKEVEHLDVYKNSFNLIPYSKNYKKLGNEILDFYNQRLKEKSDYLDRIKNNNSKLEYFKEVIRVKKHDKMRLRKIKRTEPFPLFSFKDIIKKSKAQSLNEIDLENEYYNLHYNSNYNRIFYVHKIYEKLKKKYVYYNKQLKGLKKKRKYTFKLKFHLWKTLSEYNNNKINYLKTLPLDLDYQLQFLPIFQNNYLLQKKVKLKKNILYTIFTNYSDLIFRNTYKVKTSNKFIKSYQVHFVDNMFYIYINLKKIIINTYYNNFFFINYNSMLNYYNNFYDFLKLKLLNNIKLQLNNKNYYNLFSYKIKKINNKFNINNIYNTITYKKSINKLKYKKFLNTLYNKVKYTSIKLMKQKKWTKHAMTKISKKFLKQLVANNVKLNMYVNDKSKIFNKDLKVNYYLTSTVFKEAYKPVKISKYQICFFNFLKKFAILQQYIIKKNQKQTYYIAKKYNFLISFLRNYLKKLFDCLKYIFYSNANTLYLYLLKLKFILVYIYYKVFMFFIKSLKSKIKKNKKLIFSNKLFTFNSILYYKKIIKKCFYNKKWYIKKEKKENDIDNKYSQPINRFKYNPLLNPRHNLWAKRKIQKYKRIFSVIKYKMNGYLRWYKWETRRRFNYKYRILLLKKRLKKRQILYKKKKAKKSKKKKMSKKKKKIKKGKKKYN